MSSRQDVALETTNVAGTTETVWSILNAYRTGFPSVVVP